MFYHAIITMWHGGNPYLDPAFMSPPWVLIILSPFALLPERIGYWAWVLVSIRIYAYVFRVWRFSPLMLLAFLTCPPMIWSLWYGNLEALIILALVIPAPLEMVALAVKPQLGIMTILYKLIQNWRASWLLILCGGLSVIFYGAWWVGAGRLTQVLWNMSGFPIYIPLGLAVFYQALMHNNERQTLAASLCIAPYFNFGALLLLPLAAARTRGAYYLTIVGTWVVWFLLIWQHGWGY